MEKCCTNCKYLNLTEEEHPCDTCIGYNNWLYANPDNDPVNHPSHYYLGNIECIDAMEAAFGKEAVANFCACNAFKYIFRFQNKNGLEDVKKARWYLDKYEQLMEELTNG